MRLAAAALFVFVVGCRKEQSHRLPASDIRAQNTLSVMPKGDAFEISDPAGSFALTLPYDPALQGELIEQQGVRVFNARALMINEVSVQFDVTTMPDHGLPQDLSSFETVPEEVAAAKGDQVVKHDSGKLAGAPALIIEEILSDKRRMFNWTVRATSQARIYLISCVGEDTPMTRTACNTVAGSFVLKGG